MTKKNNIAIEYTETAKFSLHDLANHLRLNNVEPKPILTKIIDYFEKKVSLFPIGCPLSQDLVNLGCTKYRECNTTNGYRIIYSFNEIANVITAHAILSQKQDLSALLFKRIIIY